MERADMADTITVTNRELARMTNALRILGNRRMANVGADLKVARLLKQLMPLAEPLENARRRITLDILDGKELSEVSSVETQRLTLKINEAQDALDHDTVEANLTLAWALKEADLPKEQSGDRGWENANGLGALIADLGVLYHEES